MQRKEVEDLVHASAAPTLLFAVGNIAKDCGVSLVMRLCQATAKTEPEATRKLHLELLFAFLQHCYAFRCSMKVVGVFTVCC